MTFTHALATNNYGPAKFIVATSAANGTHTTLASAMAAATSGDTIILRDSVTENVTLTPGVNITSWGSGSSLDGTGKAAIIGTLTMTAAGSVTISGIQLQTNSAAFLTVSGSVASIVNLENCYLNCVNSTGVSFSSSSSSAAININNCTGNIASIGIALFSSSSAGTLNFISSQFNNTGASTTANTVSAGNLQLSYTNIVNPTTTSGTSSFIAFMTQLNATAVNATGLTVGGSAGNTMSNCVIGGGSAAALSVGSTLNINATTISSTATNAITGAGTLNFGLLDFTNSKSITTSTQTSSDAGTFTPALNFGGSTTGITYSQQVGVYTRIGSLIYFCVDITLSSKGAQAGAATITGLPFTSANNGTAPACSVVASLVATGASSQLIASISGNSTTIQLLFMTLSSSTAFQSIPNTSFVNTSALIITGVYTTS